MVRQRLYLLPEHNPAGLPSISREMQTVAQSAAGFVFSFMSKNIRQGSAP
jgi:hypothetical protein